MIACKWRSRRLARSKLIRPYSLIDTLSVTQMPWITSVLHIDQQSKVRFRFVLCQLGAILVLLCVISRYFVRCARRLLLFSSPSSLRAVLQPTEVTRFSFRFVWMDVYLLGCWSVCEDAWVRARARVWSLSLAENEYNWFSQNNFSVNQRINNQGIRKYRGQNIHFSRTESN